MIKFADDSTASLVRQMWKVSFGDTDEYLDILFKYKYSNENTLIYFEGDKAVASLQMLPYSITFYRATIPFAYLAGLCTLPEYRNRGYMTQLIHEAHKVIASRNIPLSILIPAEESLYDYYRRFNYEQTFEKDDEVIPLKKIIHTYTDKDSAYSEFDSIFRYKDFCVQKSKIDFHAIVEDFLLDDCPDKTNLSGMARISDTWLLLKLFAEDNLQKKIKIKINDNTNGESSTYYIHKGKVELILGSNLDFDIELDSRLLCRLLFGFKIEGLDLIYTNLFDKHHPVMNLMLE